MTQEVQVIITLEVDITQTKDDIIAMINSKLDDLVSIDSIKEESEIFETENVKLPIFWSTNDFESQAEYNFNELKETAPEEFKHLTSWEQLYDKSKFSHELERMIAQHDATIGITWLTIEEHLANCEIK